jgi:hypothetical protein
MTLFEGRSRCQTKNRSASVLRVFFHVYSAISAYDVYDASMSSLEKNPSSFFLATLFVLFLRLPFFVFYAARSFHIP